MCAEDLGDKILFDENKRARVPVSAYKQNNPNAVDHYGQPKPNPNVFNIYQWKYLAIYDYETKFNTSSPLFKFKKLGKKPNWKVLDKYQRRCFQDVDKHYYEVMERQQFNITATTKRTYPDVKMT
ncbi:expressed unknown protein [Seminavis robusta]|uniref:Uncharacterized protein n=1 Tax=Seminavis robusta TaxID=568900 RepID=A0A9N8HD41_9STRA|nr:expressed unknown protein [Seminavis robusta]|eukprot:Sro327_g118340.1 n/a (125) ;mRNA; r:27873-28491